MAPSHCKTGITADTWPRCFCVASARRGTHTDVNLPGGSGRPVAWVTGRLPRFMACREGVAPSLLRHHQDGNGKSSAHNVPTPNYGSRRAQPNVLPANASGRLCPFLLWTDLLEYSHPKACRSIRRRRSAQLVRCSLSERIEEERAWDRGRARSEGPK
jgi:hypothetical protein